jgi:hypothetical protein
VQENVIPTLAVGSAQMAQGIDRQPLVRAATDTAKDDGVEERHRSQGVRGQQVRLVRPSLRL